MKRERKPGDEKPPPLAGSILLAHPSMREGSFRRTVILLPAHDENGSMGIVLNRPLGKLLRDVSSEFVFSPLAEVPVFSGGPVAEDRLLLCAWKFHPEGLGFQLMFGVDPQKAIEMQAEPGMHVSAFFGYAGWSAGQLEKELKQDAWVVTPLMPHLLEGEHDERLWKKILGGISLEWKLSAGEPDDMELN